MNPYEARALHLYQEMGVDGLRLVALCDRANADGRYKRGDVDWALTCINRAVAVEDLIKKLTEDSPNETNS